MATFSLSDDVRTAAWLRLSVALLLLGAAPAWCAEVRGTVFGPTETPLPRATVFLTPPTGDPLTTTTDARGRYAFTGVRPGRFVVVAAHKGLAAQRQPAVVASDRQVVGIYFRLQIRTVKANSLSGTVLREKDRTPLAGATVTLIRELPADERAALEKRAAENEADPKLEDALAEIYRHFTTDETGFYLFTGLKPGRYALGVEAPGRPKVQPRALRVDAGAGQTLDLVLEEGYVLRVSALKPDGTLAVGARAWAVQDARPIPPGGPVEAGADGAVTIAGLRPGSGWAYASLHGLPNGVVAFSIPQETGAILQVRIPDCVTVHGTLRDSAGKPVSGARVFCHRTDVEDATLYGVDDPVTDGAGRFRIAVAPPGTVEVRAEREGYRRAVRTCSFPAAGGEVAVDLTMDPLAFGRLRGRLLKPDGTPAQGIRVHANVPDIPQQHAVTDARGEFRFSKLPTGKGGLSFEAIQPEWRNVEFEIRKDQETVVPDVTVLPGG